MSRKRIVWTYWFVTAILLTLWLAAGWTAAIDAVVALTAIQVAHFLFLEKRIEAFPVQVRIAYLLIAVAGYWWPLFFLHWIQFAGTWAFVTVGYCPLARMMMLLPWNREWDLGWRSIWVLITTPPADGSIRDKLAATTRPA